MNVPFFQTSLPGGNSEWEPPDPFPNSEVKTLSADGSVGSPHVRVGHRQALYCKKPASPEAGFFFALRTLNEPALAVTKDQCAFSIMKIVLLGHEDIASVVALDKLVRSLPEHEFVAFWSSPAPARETSHPALYDLAKFDRRLFDRYITRSDTSSVLKQAATLARPNSDDGLETLRAASPDLVVSIRYRMILKEAAIGIPGSGVLNLHSGILPDYRGVMATFWAMLHGEDTIGATLHRIVDAGIDTGPVIDVSRQPVDYDRSYLANVLSLYDAGCKNVVKTTQILARGGVISDAIQSSSAGRYFSSPKPADVDEFLRKGLKLKQDRDFMHSLRRSAAPVDTISNIGKP